MHRLILMRHAKAGAAAAGRGDRDRPLTDEGRADAVAVGRALAARDLRPDHALVSDARRTRETWEGLSESFGDVELSLEASAYDAPAERLRSLVEDREDAAGCLIVLAHNPGVHQLAVDYLIEGAASPGVIDRLTAGFPP
ncbi:MAG: histidine phosphatase family protein, partial [Brevundimonas sp.]